MFWNHIPEKKRNIFPVILLYLGICFWYVNFSLSATVQATERRTGEIKIAEMGITVRAEDVEKAREKTEETRSHAEKTIRELELLISDLKTDIESANAELETLRQESRDYRASDIDPGFFEFLNKELSVFRERIDVDKELIETYEDQIAALRRQLRAYDDQVALLESIQKIDEALKTVPYEQIQTIRKEIDVSRGYTATSQANLKERDAIVSFFTQELEDVKQRTSEREQSLARELELMKSEIDDPELIKKAEEKIEKILHLRRLVNEKWVTIFQTRLKTAHIRYDQALQILKNADLNVAFLAEKINRLEKKKESEELERKQIELEAARNSEEVHLKIAEKTRAEAEKAFQEAVRKEEEAALKQQIAVSPERKRVLELEAEVHRQAGLVARRKDELITDGTQRYRDITEYKKLEADLGLLLNKSIIPSEIGESLKKVESEIRRFSYSRIAVENLIGLLQQEESLLADNLTKAYNEAVRTENEIAAFQNKELAQMAKEYAYQRIELLDEQRKLISARLERLNERLEIKNDALTLLEKKKEELLALRAANIWTREESDISVETIKAVYTDLTDLYGHIDYLFASVDEKGRRMMAYLYEKKGTITFWIRLGLLTTLLAGLWFIKRRFYKWSAGRIQALYEVYVSYYKSRLLPGLFIIAQKSITFLLITIFFLIFSVLFRIDDPAIIAVILVLTLITAYKVLKGFLVESISPEKGDKKLITSFAYVSPIHLYKSLNAILLFSLISLSTISVLTVFSYKHDVIELLWFIYRVGMLILLLWLATQKTLLFKLLPNVESQLGKLIYRIITIIYPVFIVFVVSLFAIRSLGYSVLTYALLRTCIKSFVIVFIAFFIWKYLDSRLNYLKESRLKSDTGRKTASDSEEKKLIPLEFCDIVLKYSISLITAIVVIRVWFMAFYDALYSPAAPYIVQKTFRYVNSVFDTIKRWMQYRFVFEEGRYTTPVKIIFALIILIIAFFAARYIKNLLEEKVFNKFRLERGPRQTLSNIIRYTIVAIAAVIGLNMAGIPLRSLTIFAGAFGIGVGFGMQNIISNFVSGIILLFERPLRVGDVITLEDGVLGTIERINARSTTLLTPDGITITVPNAKFIDNRVTNWTLPTSRLRGVVKVGVAYGSDVNLVKKCLLDIAKQNTNVKIYPEPFVRFAEFGDNALKFELYFWGDDPGKRWFTMSELHFAIDEVFRKNNIVIAFPLRDIHIRSVVPFPVPFQDKQGEMKKDEFQDTILKKTNE
ncbi:MAG: mechanosensitive ion channel [Candidatus Brocadiaceae baterium WH-1]|nr:MAG: mechanosensitive ion channel [Candidatus Jettenia sp. AMX2]